MPTGRSHGRAKSVEAYDTLRAQIISGELKPGDPLAEEAIAERLGTSRTPVREALNLLRAQGWVRADAAGRATVAGLSMADLRELFELRRALEACSARLAATAQNRDVLKPFLAELEASRQVVAAGRNEEYHELMTRIDGTIAKLANNVRLEEMLRDVWSHLARARAVTCTDAKRLEESIERRAAILTAIIEGDRERSERLAEEHVDHGLSVTIERIVSGTASNTSLSAVS